jgi:hypothetical protein
MWIRGSRGTENVRLWSSGLCHHAILYVLTDISEQHIASNPDDHIGTHDCMFISNVKLYVFRQCHTLVTTRGNMNI